MDDVITFVGGDIPLFVLGPDELKPVIGIAIGVLLYKFPPLADIVGAYGFITWLAGNDGIGKVNIGVYQLCGFDTGGTDPAGVGRKGGGGLVPGQGGFGKGGGFVSKQGGAGVFKKRGASGSGLKLAHLFANCILGKCQGERQGAAAFVAKEEKCMTQPIVLDQFDQLFLDLSLPDDISK